MTDSAIEVKRVHRVNLPSLNVSENGLKDVSPIFAYSIPLDNPEETAKMIKSIFDQYSESNRIVVKTSNRVYLPNGETLLNVHDEANCEGRGCSVHHPSDHHMKSWRQHYRTDRAMMERICPDHGIGHPDPDDVAFHKAAKDNFDGTHGCCGCCVGDRKQKPKAAK